ncbi:MAG: AraC family transcriptional regulator [Acidobacteria bacterium]|nr:AraC family transcriptional regulator [Acidobacteriota bacterium]
MRGNRGTLKPFSTALFLVPALAVLGILAGSQPIASAGEKESAITRKEVSTFTVVGIEARTDNRREAGEAGVIPGQWQKFFSQDIPAKIPNKTGPDFYAIYARYSSGHNGEYNYVVGARVKDGTVPPEGMVAIRVAAGNYAVFTTDKGPLAKIMPAAWQKINQLADGGKLRRKYQTDFEVYDQRAQDPQNAQVEIYVGIL